MLSMFSFNWDIVVAPIILLVKNGLVLTKAKASCVKDRSYFLATAKYFFVAVMHFSLLYLVNHSPYLPNLEFLGMLSIYLPVNIPKPRGEYANNPIFSL